MSITKGYSPPTAAPIMHDTFLDVIGSNSATFLNKDANLLMFETIFDSDARRSGRTIYFVRLV